MVLINPQGYAQDRIGDQDVRHDKSVPNDVSVLRYELLVASFETNVCKEIGEHASKV